MRRTRRALTAIMLIGAFVAAPAAQAKSSGPVSAMLKPGDCSTLTYQWSGYRKAAAATFELRPNGAYLDAVTTAPVAAAGSLVIPAELVAQIIAGEHYTVLAVLRDGSGRAIQNSPAVWWGYC